MTLSVPGMGCAQEELQPPGVITHVLYPSISIHPQHHTGQLMWLQDRWTAEKNKCRLTSTSFILSS